MTALLLRGSALRGGRVLLRDLDLAVAAGQWTCLLGPSGVGKTTILRLCAGLADGVEWRGRLVTPGPGQVVERLSLNFGQRYADGEACRSIKSDPEFIAQREYVLGKVFQQREALL